MNWAKDCYLCHLQGHDLRRDRLLRHLKSSHDHDWDMYWNVVIGPRPECSTPGCTSLVGNKNGLVELGYSEYCSQPCQASYVITKNNLENNPSHDPEILSRMKDSRSRTLARWRCEAEEGSLHNYVSNVWRRGAHSEGDIVYILKSNTTIKVGLTSNVGYRLGRMQRVDPSYIVAEFVVCSTNEEAEKLERSILESLGVKCLVVDKLNSDMPYGWTETFKLEHLTDAISYLNKERK
ncbi:hypothetical protein VP150E351_P0164 [Vibrio phage 150E35-1]|nr:hypothetical protein VP150E351_P0164 [Vibrio phage 150E35-1]